MEQVDSVAPAPIAPVARRKIWPAVVAVLALAAAVIAAVTLTGGKSHSKHITQLGYDDGPWPFTVSAVDIKCKNGDALLRIEGIDYALDDKARAAGYPSSFGGYWLDDPSTPGAKEPIFKLIMQAEDLC